MTGKGPGVSVEVDESVSGGDDSSATTDDAADKIDVGIA